jgi:hypothetical protein
MRHARYKWVVKYAKGVQSKGGEYRDQGATWTEQARERLKMELEREEKM